MANKEHIDIIKQGYKVWNKWRRDNPDIKPDLSKVDLSAMDFSYMNLSGVDFIKSDLGGSDFINSKFNGAYLCGADLDSANLRKADLRFADMVKADLNFANLSQADLRGADLSYCTLVETNIEGANLSDSYIYGASVWNIKVNTDTTQTDLIITQKQEPLVTVDSIEVAQFIYLILNNKKIRDVIDTIGKKVVLILGRFTDDRKPVLDAIRSKLRAENYLPVMFDFDKPSLRNTQETVLTLASLSKFVIADMTDPVCIPFELGTIVKELRSVPIQPILLQGKKTWGMWDSIEGLPWVLDIAYYKDCEDLICSLDEKVLLPVERKLNEKRV